MGDVCTPERTGSSESGLEREPGSELEPVSESDIESGSELEPVSESDLESGSELEPGAETKSELESMISTETGPLRQRAVSSAVLGLHPECDRVVQTDLPAYTPNKRQRFQSAAINERPTAPVEQRDQGVFTGVFAAVQRTRVVLRSYISGFIKN
jgi:hypothetical protein